MNPAQVKLSEVASVQLGIAFRGADAARHQPNGSHRLIRIGEISEDGDITIGDGEPHLIGLDFPGAARGELRAGDVLVAARGSRMTAAVFDGSFSAVAGSQFGIIRPDRNKLLPQYLRWFLNLPAIQESLQSQARGSYVRSLPIGALNNLEVAVPSLDRQHVIAEIHQLRLQEKHLTARLVEHQAILINHTLLRAAKP